MSAGQTDALRGRPENQQYEANEDTHTKKWKHGMCRRRSTMPRGVGHSVTAAQWPRLKRNDQLIVCEGRPEEWWGNKKQTRSLYDQHCRVCLMWWSMNLRDANHSLATQKEQRVSIRKIYLPRHVHTDKKKTVSIEHHCQRSSLLLYAGFFPSSVTLGALTKLSGGICSPHIRRLI